jgi:hypothetical protein
MCRVKGHLTKDCPNGNITKSKLVNSSFDVHDKAIMGNGARKVISSPHVSTKTIKVPKFLLTNFEGSNKTWIPRGRD